ncbi:MAG: Maf family protein [Xanthomonadales bacterium]|nr:Maf family protein [Xanthomonadales bacterium]
MAGSTPQAPLILASASPRRLELLQQIGFSPVVHPADVDETPWPSESPDAYVARIAQAKVSAVAALYPHAVVIGSDTTVVGPSGILGKPKDHAEARAMLQQLRGRHHQVLTAVCVAQGEHIEQKTVASQVLFRLLNDAEIDAYIASGEPMDKAGAYAIQGLGAVFVAHLEGSYSGVMGLPLCETAALLKPFGLHPLQASDLVS